MKKRSFPPFNSISIGAGRSWGNQAALNSMTDSMQASGKFIVKKERKSLRITNIDVNKFFLQSCGKDRQGIYFDRERFMLPIYRLLLTFLGRMFRWV
ncbi:hypothetical protein D5R40_25380 [Okeania hirsuta]|uniref:Uncharacterized protein n=1 Tax=Okeania hirsuta TaxID=1458930 RepID=A0A3N6QA19_9CYAN|nr:hypothetical protein D5R40_25380 [Okeania hirsuta]